MIKVANPNAQYLTYRAEIDAAIRGVLEGGRYILGPEVSTFEKEYGSYAGQKHAIGVASGTDALRLALLAQGIGAGDEVILPTLTAVATAMAVLSVGAMPVLADVESSSFLLSADSAEPLITERSRAIIPVHLYGRACDMDGFQGLTSKHELALIEDCAQAHGATWRGQAVGSFGEAGCFSFYPTKNLGAMGDGGLVLTGDDELAASLERTRQYGWSQPQISSGTGECSRLDELQAAILRVKLPHLDTMNEARRTLAGRYAVGLGGLPLTCPESGPDGGHVFHQYVIRQAGRDDLAAFLNSRQIGTAIHYPLPLHRQPFWQAQQSGAGDFPVCDALIPEILSLPMDPFMSEADQDTVIAAIREFHGA